MEESQFTIEERILARDATKSEFPWIKGPLKRGHVVYAVMDKAFDVASRDSIKVSLNPEGGSFFDLPSNMLELPSEDEEKKSSVRKEALDD